MLTGVGGFAHVYISQGVFDPLNNKYWIIWHKTTQYNTG